MDCPISRAATVPDMAPRKRKAADLTGIRLRGARFQVRIFGGIDPATGKQLILTGSATTEDDAIAMRDGFRTQIDDHTTVRTNGTLRVLLAEWLAGHQVEPSTRASYALLIDKFILPALGDQTLPTLAKLGPRPYEKLYAELRTCRRRCSGKTFFEHRTPRAHECDERCAPHVCRPLAASSIRQMSRRVEQRVRGGRAVGLGGVQPDEGGAEASPSGAGPRSALAGGSRPDRGGRVGRRPWLGPAGLGAAGDRRPPGRGARAALGEPLDRSGVERSRAGRRSDPRTGGTRVRIGARLAGACRTVARRAGRVSGLW